MNRCGSCGAENEPGALFCSACNQFMEWDDSPAATPPPTGPLHLVAAPDPFAPAEPEVTREDEPQAAPLPVITREDEPQAAPTSEPEPHRPPPVAAARHLKPATPRPVVRSPAPTTTVHDIIGAIDTGRELATSSGRTDLDRHLGRTREQLEGRPVPVVVLGEFKQGKSTLVNALLQSAVCPVDADVVTAVPTLIRYANEPRITTFVQEDDGSRSQEEDMPLDSLPRLVTEEADLSQPLRQRSVEVGLPHRMLRAGLVLVDTPGLGGLDSAHGFLTLGALRDAEGVLFVTDASQELTGPELEFLRTAAERCERLALVITKVDLYPQWRRIVELNRGHLERAGLALPIIPVSSFLRLRAQKDPDLNLESGFADLVTFLARDVVAASRESAARAAAVEVEFVATQLAQQTEAERAVIEAPEQSEAVVAELDAVQRQARQLASPTATWQQTLADGIQDLVSDVEHDLQSRLRAVLKEAEEAIDQGDPKDTWEQTEAWLRRNVAIATLANRDLLADRAEELAASVADQFALPSGSGLTLQLQAADDALDAISLAPASSFTMPGGKLAPLMTAARSGFILPMVLGSAAANAIGLMPITLIVLGVSAALGAGIGKKIIKDERQRQLTYRQQQAKSAARKFVDEVAFRMNKQSRDSLRMTQRRLRDDFQERALLLERSASQSMAAVQRAGTLGDDEQRGRGEELADRGRRLAQVRAAARSVAAVQAA